MDQAFFADVQVASSGAAAPVVGLAFGDAVLKPVEAGVVFVAQFLDLLKNVFLFIREWLQRAIVVVNHPDRS